MTGEEALAKANELLAAAEADPGTAADQLELMPEIADDDPLAAEVRGIGSMLFMMADAGNYLKDHPAAA